MQEPERPPLVLSTDGLNGDQIPKLVRILFIADVYDALSSDRPYREGLPHEQCVAILRKDVEGGSLDRELVEAFCSIDPAHFTRTGSGIVAAAPMRRTLPDFLLASNPIPARSSEIIGK